jgi:hypothetical protein
MYDYIPQGILWNVVIERFMTQLIWMKNTWLYILRMFLHAQVSAVRFVERKLDNYKDKTKLNSAGLEKRAFLPTVRNLSHNYIKETDTDRSPKVRSTPLFYSNR